MAKSVKLGVGLDVGTMNLVSAKMEKGKVQTSRVRDAFLDLEELLRNLKLEENSFEKTSENMVNYLHRDHRY